MKSVIICLITLSLLFPLGLDAGEKRVYTDADLEKYKTSSSLGEKKADTGDHELQQGKTGEKNEEGQTNDVETNSRRAREASRR